MCIRQRIESSNLSLTAIFSIKDVLGRLFLCLKYLKINDLKTNPSPIKSERVQIGPRFLGLSRVPPAGLFVLLLCDSTSEIL
ncbi:DUF1418 family protein [Vibrio breoganii]